MIMIDSLLCLSSTYYKPRTVHVSRAFLCIVQIIMPNNQNIEVGQRLKTLRTFLNLEQVEFGEHIGKGRNTIISWEKGRTSPTDAQLTLISNTFGCSERWLSTGQGQMLLHNHAIAKKRYKNDGVKDFRVWGVTGAGQRFDYNMQENDPENLKPMELIPLDSIMDSNFIDGFKVSGDSMEPGIMDGAYIAVNFTDKKLQTGSIFVFNYPHEGLVVKKVQVKKDTVKIYSYNELYDPEEYASAELDEYVIVGRVVWIHNKV